MKNFTLIFFVKLKWKRVTKQPQGKGVQHDKQRKKIICKKLIWNMFSWQFSTMQRVVKWQQHDQLHLQTFFKQKEITRESSQDFFFHT